LKYAPPIRIYLFHKVADVFIVSPDEISLPPIGRRIYTEADSGGERRRDASSETVSEENEESFTPLRQEREKVVSPDKRLEQDRVERVESSASEAAPAGFRLDLQPYEKTDFSFRLSPPKKAAEDAFVEKAPRKMDPSLFVSPGLSSLNFRRTRSGRNIHGVQAPRSTQEVLSHTADFDISPWAKEVLDKIRSSWILPPIKESEARGKVKILVIVGKDGKLHGLEVVESSNVLLFDESAVEAIRSSAPFLPLPDDFPSERLETYLVFEFNE
jgi:TonB family protein